MPNAPLPITPLPIDGVLPSLVAALSAGPCVVLRAPTGAGKTTRVPPALLDAGLAGRGKIVMLEPRRLAARAAARRIAFERGVELGREVGFHVRFERKASAATRILVVTEGLLVRMLQDDPFLEGIGAVVFDEFHERSLHTDLALALVRKVQREARGDLKLVVMSATIATADVALWLGGAPVIESEGRLHPVEIRYGERSDPRAIAEQCALGIGRALESTAGDVLAFLPGVGEIRRTREKIDELARRRDLLVCELYGDLPAEEQDRVLQRAARRKIVLATNVAETSVTIEGITAVVDSGWARISRYDSGVGLDRLELTRISRASADQRAGRAGRTAPGVCVRMWSEGEQRSLSEHEEPEIARVDLAAPILQLFDFGERDPHTFPWFEKPPTAAIERALELLRAIGATHASALTPIGRELARLPVHPRLGRLLIEGRELGCLPAAALAGALLSERDPFLRARSPRERASRHRSDSDVFDRVRALDEFAHSVRTESEVGTLNTPAARFALRASEDLERLVARGSDAHQLEAHASEPEFLRALLAAYADRVVRRRDNDPERGVLVGGRGVKLAEESAVYDGELYLAVDIDAGRAGERAEALVRQASRIEREWLAAELVTSSTDMAFDSASKRVVAWKRTRYLDLVLDEAPFAPPADEEAARVLAAAAATDLERALALRDEPNASFLARVRFLRRTMPELGLPALDEAELVLQLPELCLGSRSFADLERIDLVQRLTARWTHAQRQALAREAPEHISVPTGSAIRLAYEEGRAPVLAVRIQEIFGMAETPRIAGGRVKLVLHLLAPNYRPQQVTDDLASFWKNAYFEVRKDLRTRYPKHSWPEDPLTAPPQRKGGRRSPS